MKLVDITATVIRGMGILVLIKSTAMLVGMMKAMDTLEGAMGSGNDNMALAYAFSVPAFFGMVVILFPMTIARFIVPSSAQLLEEAGGNGNGGLTREELQRAGLFVVGAFVLVRAVPDIAHTLAMLLFIPEGMMGDEVRNLSINLGIALLEVGIGAALMLGGRGINNLTARLRGAGLH
ncbi:MAG: hypothetical protein K0S16_2035 [Moraxellaceae bacterium]|jgi:hypothetical protein|nr:hypothetical protein [Moraxellaceae bacterium]